ncbi:hypothetical protein FZZ93_09090 [Halomonas eurihalina]|uniref:Uncharacterized protein n=1 Tax=Halomonas eurihalina TaxID=42566 RepID=A0A5D9D7Z4_HALER|nr:hypothetical protein [Halomonas eurihalina]MDR5859902.1 hypothetical protein [Halomonas eurihalina]TZG39916.1 hypothetical protein FZZ93_09090 [Halomonas eurihalina]
MSEGSASGSGEQALADRARRVLETLPESALPITYRQLAETLGLTPPRTIQRVTTALEALMHEDVRQARPMIAALVVSQRGGESLPATGFFELAAALGRLPADPARRADAYREEFRRALAARG